MFEINFVKYASSYILIKININLSCGAQRWKESCPTMCSFACQHVFSLGVKVINMFMPF